MTPNATRIKQSLSFFVSLDSCYYLLLKKLNWFSFWMILHIIKSASTLRIGRSGKCMLIITHGNNKKFSQISVGFDGFAVHSESVESAEIFKS